MEQQHNPTDTAASNGNEANASATSIAEKTADAIKSSPKSEKETTLTGSDLIDAIIHQIEFYFSAVNLPKDDFMKKQMAKDETGLGFVQLSVIMSFNKMKNLCKDVDIVREILKQSAELVLSDDERSVRRKIPLDLPDSRKVYVSFLPRSTTQAQCEDMFSKYGEIKSVELPMEGGVCRGFAYVEFDTAAAANRAMQQHDNYDGVRVKPYGQRPLILDGRQIGKENNTNTHEVKKDLEPRRSVYEQSPVLSYQKAKTTPKKREVVAYEWETHPPAEGRPKLNLAPRNNNKGGASGGKAESSSDGSGEDSGDKFPPARQPRGPDGTRGFKPEGRKMPV